jgi:hypothetical protein
MSGQINHIAAWSNPGGGREKQTATPQIAIAFTAMAAY